MLGQHFSSPCEVLLAALDVYLIHPGEDWLETINVLQPDILVICDPEKLHERGCIGPPDLVVEILSPGTAKKDLGPKRDLYEEYGVKEMWIVHPVEGTVVVHVLENGKYHILPIVAKGQTLQSAIFPDLKVDLDQVFTDDRFE
jgi:Uma2 family endonuclease